MRSLKPFLAIFLANNLSANLKFRYLALLALVFFRILIYLNNKNVILRIFLSTNLNDYTLNIYEAQ